MVEFDLIGEIFSFSCLKGKKKQPLNTVVSNSNNFGLKLLGGIRTRDNIIIVRNEKKYRGSGKICYRN